MTIMWKLYDNLESYEGVSIYEHRADAEEEARTWRWAGFLVEVRSYPSFYRHEGWIVLVGAEREKKPKAESGVLRRRR